MKALSQLRQWWLLLLLAAVVLIPILLRPREQAGNSRGAEKTLVIITPHNEATREEFGRGFADWYFARTGERVSVDWRSPGGTSEIARYLAGEYFASFQNYWSQVLHHPWNSDVESAYASSKTILPKDPASDSLAQKARRAFIAPEEEQQRRVTCRIDVFFGGGSFDYEQQAAAGRIVDSGFIAAHPELFGPQNIPQTLGGETFWDPQGRWIGTCLAAFGICSNRDSLRRLGIEKAPAQWADLADPRYLHEIALANPTQSGSVNKAIEMLVQQQMIAAVDAAKATAGGTLSDEQKAAALANGWAAGMQLLQKVSANARYFTDSSTKIVLDVGAGEAAAGMTIDFYGRFESEALREPDGSSRLQYTDVVGGTSAGTDPIALFRGAPHPELAREFIAYVMSPEGQKLWNWKVGAPGGPKRYALRRSPILPALYAPEFRQFRSDPDVNPYELATRFTYHGDWTGPLFRQLAFIVRVMCIDPHEELVEAWGALIKAGFPPQATARFSDVSAVGYEAAKGPIKKGLGEKIGEVQLAKTLADSFHRQYREAAELARAGK